MLAIFTANMARAEMPSHSDYSRNSNARGGGGRRGINVQSGLGMATSVCSADGRAT